MDIVYVLYHEYEPEPGVDEEKLIGIYSTKEKAEHALARSRQRPGFCDFPENFIIYDYEIDHDGWEEGFVRLQRSEQ